MNSRHYELIIATLILSLSMLAIGSVMVMDESDANVSVKFHYMDYQGNMLEKTKDFSVDDNGYITMDFVHCSWLYGNDLGVMYTLIGWYDNPDFTGNPVLNGEKTAAKSEYWAKYVEPDSIFYPSKGATMTMDAGDVILVDLPLSYVTSITSGAPNGFHKQYTDLGDCFYYGGLVTDPGTYTINLHYNDVSIQSDGILTLVVNNVFKVRFSSEGSELHKETVQPNATVQSYTPEPREGYVFCGWYTDPTFQTPFNFNTPITSHLTLYAKWGSSFSVTFMSEGSVVHSETVNPEAIVQSYTPPAREGYTFSGWYTDPTFQTPFDFNTPITSDITLYAKWIENPVTITFMVEGKIHSTLQVPKGSVGVVYTPVMVEGVFAGWYYDDQFQRKYDATVPLDRDTTLHALGVPPLIFTSEPNAAANIQQVNSYGMFFFDATDSSGRYQIHWDFGDGNTSDEAIAYNTYSEPGLYTVTLTVTNIYGESATSTYEIDLRNGSAANDVKWFAIGALCVIVAGFVVRRIL